MQILLLLLLVLPMQAPANQISAAQKKEFLELLKTLPHKGEFFTDDAVKTAGPYLPVLFALTDNIRESAHFNVERAFRGVSGGAVEIAYTGTSCDFSFREGKTYLVYAYRNSERNESGRGPNLIKSKTGWSQREI